MPKCQYCDYHYKPHGDNGYGTHKTYDHYLAYEFLLQGVLDSSVVRDSPTGELHCPYPACTFGNRIDARKIKTHIQTTHLGGKELNIRASGRPPATPKPFNFSPSPTPIQSSIIVNPSSTEVLDHQSSQNSLRLSTDFVEDLPADPSPHSYLPHSFHEPDPRSPDAGTISRGRSPVASGLRRSIPRVSTTYSHPYRKSSHVSNTRSASPPENSSGKASPAGYQASPLGQTAFVQYTGPADVSNVRNDAELPLSEDEVLARGSLRILQVEGTSAFPRPIILACRECLSGINPNKALEHIETHSIVLTRSERKAISVIIEGTRFATCCQDLPSISPGRAPVEGLSVRSGYLCKLCTHGCPLETTHKKHVREHHPGVSSDSDQAKGVLGHIQTYFKFRVIYFAVVPSLSGVPAGDPWETFLNGIAKEIDATDIVNPPEGAQEIPPLERMTGWRDYIGEEVLSDRRKVRALNTLTDVPVGLGLGWAVIKTNTRQAMWGLWTSGLGF